MMMYAHLLRLSCLLLAAFISISLHAQDTPKPDTRTIFNERIIEYKWKEGKFEHVMPFDDPFVIRITNMPLTIDSLKLVLYEIRGNYNLFKIKKDTITDAQFKAMTEVKKYIVKTWSRPKGSTDTFAHIAIPYYLKPNSKYIIEISGEELKKPEDSELESIRAVIRKSQPIRNLISDYARAYMTSDSDLPRFSQFISDLNKTISKEVSDLDRRFIFRPSDDDLPQLKDLGVFVSTLRNLMIELDELAEDASDENKAIAKSFRDKLSKTNFGEFLTTSVQKNLSNELENFRMEGIDSSEMDMIEEVKNLYSNISTSIKQVINNIIKNYAVNNVYTLDVIASNYPINMTDQADRYLGLDIGQAYIFNYSRFHTYYGINVYLRPVNKNIPLSRYKHAGDFLLTRTSILLGITFSSVEKENIRKGIIDNKGVIVGAGFRIVSFFRINAGGLLYYRYPIQPLQETERYTTKMSPFVSLSLDLDMEALLEAVGKSIFPAKSNTNN